MSAATTLAVLSLAVLSLAPTAAAYFVPSCASAKACYDLQTAYASCDPDNHFGVDEDTSKWCGANEFPSSPEFRAAGCWNVERQQNSLVCLFHYLTTCVTEYQAWRNCINSHLCAEYEYGPFACGDDQGDDVPEFPDLESSSEEASADEGSAGEPGSVESASDASEGQDGPADEEVSSEEGPADEEAPSEDGPADEEAPSEDGPADEDPAPADEDPAPAEESPDGESAGGGEGSDATEGQEGMDGQENSDSAAHVGLSVALGLASALAVLEATLAALL